LELDAGRDRARVGQRGDPPRMGGELMQDFEPFHVQLGGQNAHPGGIAAGMREARGEAAADHVVGHSNDRDDAGRALRRPDTGVSEGDDKIDVLSDELAGKFRRALVAAFGEDEQEADVASVFPADRLHVAPERLGEDFVRNILGIEPQHADDRHSGLCARGERPGSRRRATKQPNKFPSPHGSSLPRATPYHIVE
jgi:hypothetical protein